jgi:hypothetical protein
LLSAVEAIYDTILEPDAWPTALQKIFYVCGGTGTVLKPLMPKDEVFAITSPNQNLGIKEYQTHWWTEDYISARAAHRTKPGLMTDFDLTTPEEMAARSMVSGISAEPGYQLHGRQPGAPGEAATIPGP